MFIDISSDHFRQVFKKEIFYLPKRWDGKDFRSTIESLFDNYRKELRIAVGSLNYDEGFEDIDTLCDGIIGSIESYFSGHPAKAFERFNSVMDLLMKQPIKTYQKTGWGEFFSYRGDPLQLFRVRNVEQNTVYTRSDIFHTPYNLRSKVTTCRYSIAGYPSLYLGTSLELCGEESKISSLKELQIASRFELVRNRRHNNTSIEVIELAVKPQDFLSEKEIANIENERIIGRKFDELRLSSTETISAYISWYPLIAACSFMRVSKSDPFAAEYIIPQLLMQWIRQKNEYDELFGVRYFSCASVRASEMGFNYIFPVSGKRYKGDSQYCDTLAKSFRLTAPAFIHEYFSYEEAEGALLGDLDISNIF